MKKYHTPEMRDSYAAAGEQIRKLADTAYQKKDFGEAGSLYNTLIESGIATRISPVRCRSTTII